MLEITIGFVSHSPLTGSSRALVSSTPLLYSSHLKRYEHRNAFLNSSVRSRNDFCQQASQSFYEMVVNSTPPPPPSFLSTYPSHLLTCISFYGRPAAQISGLARPLQRGGGGAIPPLPPHHHLTVPGHSRHHWPSWGPPSCQCIPHHQHVIHAAGWDCFHDKRPGKGDHTMQ